MLVQGPLKNVSTTQKITFCCNCMRAFSVVIFRCCMAQQLSNSNTLYYKTKKTTSSQQLVKMVSFKQLKCVIKLTTQKDGETLTLKFDISCTRHWISLLNIISSFLSSLNLSALSKDSKKCSILPSVQRFVQYF